MASAGKDGSTFWQAGDTTKTSPKDTPVLEYDFSRVSIYPDLSREREPGIQRRPRPRVELDAGTQAKVKTAMKQQLAALPRVELQTSPRGDDPSSESAESGAVRAISRKRPHEELPPWTGRYAAWNDPRYDEKQPPWKRQWLGRTGRFRDNTVWDSIEKKNALQNFSPAMQPPGYGVNPNAKKPRPDDDADVLYIGSNITNSGADHLNLQQEYRGIGKHLKVKVMLNASLEAISAMIATGRFKTVILGGHGLPGQVVVTDQDGSGWGMEAEALANVLASHPSVKAVIANICFSARGKEHALTTQLSERGIASIGHTVAIHDQDAIFIGCELARLLAEGHSLEEATHIAEENFKERLIAQSNDERARAWYSPMKLLVYQAGKQPAATVSPEGNKSQVAPAKDTSDPSPETQERSIPALTQEAPQELTAKATPTSVNTDKTASNTQTKKGGSPAQGDARTKKTAQRIAAHTQVRGASAEVSAGKAAWEKKRGFGNEKGAGGTTHLEAGKASAHGRVSAGWAPGKGLQVSGNMGASVVAVGGGFEVHTKPLLFSFGGESFISRFSFGVDAAVAAEANGHLALNAATKVHGVEAGISGFAGAKVSAAVTAAVDWDKRPAAAYANTLARNIPALLGHVVPQPLLASVPQEQLVLLLREVLPVLLGKDSGPTMILLATATGEASVGVGAAGHFGAGLKGGVVHCKGRFGVTVGLGFDGELDVQLGMLDGMRLVGVLVARGIEAIVNALRPSKSLPAWLLEQAENVRRAVRAICYRQANDPHNGWAARQLMELLGDAL